VLNTLKQAGGVKEAAGGEGGADGAAVADVARKTRKKRKKANLQPPSSFLSASLPPEPEPEPEPAPVKEAGGSQDVRSNTHWFQRSDQSLHSIEAKAEEAAAKAEEAAAKAEEAAAKAEVTPTNKTISSPEQQSTQNAETQPPSSLSASLPPAPAPAPAREPFNKYGYKIAPSHKTREEMDAEYLADISKSWAILGLENPLHSKDSAEKRKVLQANAEKITELNEKEKLSYEERAAARAAAGDNQVRPNLLRADTTYNTVVTINDEKFKFLRQNREGACTFKAMGGADDSAKQTKTCMFSDGKWKDLHDGTDVSIILDEDDDEHLNLNAGRRLTHRKRIKAHRKTKTNNKTIKATNKKTKKQKTQKNKNI
jgi:hypothetical protein